MSPATTFRELSDISIFAYRQYFGEFGFPYERGDNDQEES
jgi:hypothetical protein